ncbi:MAG: phytoene desaturase family protein [Clostridium celatum]|nr:phytoene desaturase family protein [Clostridium celatum]
MKKAIIIGGGIGGLSIAARLLHKGFKVELYEKNNSIGGKTNTLKLGDFKFDLTASLLMIPNDYIDIFKYCNKDYKDYFSLIPINPLYKVFYDDGTNYSFSTSYPHLCKTINKITNNNLKDKYSYFNFLSLNYKRYLIAESHFLNEPFIKTNDFFNTYTLKEVYKLHTLKSCYSDCNNFLSSEKLINYIMFQSMYVGVSPYSSPNIYNLIPTATQYNSLYYIKGGMYSYIDSLRKLVLDLGGKINLSCPVDEILFKNNTAIGVKIKKHTIYSDLVVCSSDYCYSIDNLIKPENIKSNLEPTTKFQQSCSTFILYLALDKKYPSLNIHNIFINKNFKENLEAPFKGMLSSDPSLYIYCPSSIDSTLCPTNCETINVMVRVPNLFYNNISWTNDNIISLENKLLNIVSRIPGLEDIKSHIIFKDRLTPLDFKNIFNTTSGSAFGISHNLNQSLLFRPQCTLPNIENLYFTGASVHPGNGVSMVLKSSKICANLIKL